MHHPKHILSLLLLAPALAAAQSATRQLDTNAFIDVSRDVLPAVANISLEPKPAEPGKEESEEQALLRYFQRQQGGSGGGGFASSVSGSGVLIKVGDGKGYVLTNNHVVEDFGDDMLMTLTFHELEPGTTEYNRTTEIAGEGIRIVGADRFSDLAVIEFPMPETLKVTPISFADSDRTEIGENVIALGNPLDLNHTVTRGIISGKSRYLGSRISLEKLLQTDAAIQPGNSGGPLVNLDGKIVGINNAIATRTGYWQGIGFAIPSNDANRISTQLIEYGRVVRGYLGVNMAPVGSPAVAQRYGLQPGDGVLIERVVPNSPADVAGLHPNDVVLTIDGEKVRVPDDMLRIIASKTADAQIALSIVRLDDSELSVKLDVSATLTERPSDDIINDLHDKAEGGLPAIPEAEPTEPEPPSPHVHDDGSEAPVRPGYLGMDLSEFVDRDKNTAGLRIESLRPNSEAAINGLLKGDLITSLNGRSVRSLQDFRAAITQPMRGSHIVQYSRGGRQAVAILPAK